MDRPRTGPVDHHVRIGIFAATTAAFDSPGLVDDHLTQTFDGPVDDPSLGPVERHQVKATPAVGLDLQGRLIDAAPKEDPPVLDLSITSPGQATFAEGQLHHHRGAGFGLTFTVEEELTLFGGQRIVASRFTGRDVEALAKQTGLTGRLTAGLGADLQLEARGLAPFAGGHQAGQPEEAEGAHQKWNPSCAKSAIRLGVG